MNKVIQDRDAKHFLKKSKQLLYANEAEYSLMIGICELLIHASIPSKFTPVFLRSVNENGETTAALMQSRVENFVVTSANLVEVDSFTEYFKERKMTFMGIVGPRSTAEYLVKSFSQKLNVVFELGMASKILKLEKVVAPRQCAGEMTFCERNDTRLFADWLLEFAKEALPHDPGNSERFLAIAETKIQNREAYLWKVNGEPTAVAQVGRPTKNGISISGVYTPRELRGRGYASNLVAQISENMLGNGKSFCVLYTDAGNPTSNKIYQNLGYEIVAESAHWVLK